MKEQHKKELLLLILLSELFHIPIFMGRLSIDTCVQMEMARNFLKYGDFYVNNFSQSNHFSPILSLLYIPFTAILGFTPVAIHLYELAVLPLLIYATYRVGSLYDERVGMMAAVLVAVDPVFYGSMTAGLAEPLVTALLLLSFYYLVMATKNSSWLIAAGFVSALIYLIKTSTGYLIIAGAGVGLVWRFYYDRWKVFRNRGYLLGALVFLIIVFIWALRNFYLTGTPWTSSYTTEIFNNFIAEPLSVILSAYIYYILLFSVYLALISIGVWYLMLRNRMPGPVKLLHIAMKKQELSALLVFVFGILFMSALSAAAISTEVATSHDLPHLRYIGVVSPMVYIIVGLMACRAADSRTDDTADKKAKGSEKKARKAINGQPMDMPGTILFTLILLSILCVPSFTVYMEDGSLQSLVDYLEENDAELVFSDDAYLLEYNTESDISYRAVYVLEQIPDGSVLVMSPAWMKELQSDNSTLANQLEDQSIYIYNYYVFLDYRSIG